jgi:hypothetical protein
MRRRAVDLSLDELAAMGANAASRAAKNAEDAGLVVTGTVDPNGIVALPGDGGGKANTAKDRSQAS